MEERVPPAAGDGNPDPLPQTHHPTLPSETYVVQVPKDQIYRVPPPENALIVERHHNPARQKTSRCSSFMFFFIIILALVLVLGLIVAICSIIFKPKAPSFGIENVVVKNYTPHSHQHKQKQLSRPEYDIRLKAKNPNGYMGIFYNRDGHASLSFRQQEIAVGKYPTFYQAHKNSTVFVVVLNGSNIVLPREIETSMKSENSKVHVSLSLSMNIPVSLKIGELKIGSANIAIACNFTVDTLAKDTRVLSRECHTKGLT